MNQDSEEAVRLFRLAAGHGHEDAVSVLRRLNMPLVIPEP